MEHDFSDEQYQNLIINIINSETDYTLERLTGGNVQLSCNGGKTCKLINAKLVLYFGYGSNRNSIKHEKEISIDLINIYIKALHIAILSKQVQKNGNDFKELNYLMNTKIEKTEVIGKEVEVQGTGFGFGFGIGTKNDDQRTNIVRNSKGDLVQLDLTEIPN